jgi:hypothetical protein
VLLAGLDQACERADDEASDELTDHGRRLYLPSGLANGQCPGRSCPAIQPCFNWSTGQQASIRSGAGDIHVPAEQERFPFWPLPWEYGPITEVSSTPTLRPRHPGEL